MIKMKDDSWSVEELTDMIHTLANELGSANPNVEKHISAARMLLAKVESSNAARIGETNGRSLK